MIRIAAILLAALSAIACAPAPDDYSSVMRSTSRESISDLLALMDKHGLPHRKAEPRDGMEGFAYRTRDRASVDSFQKKLGRQTALRYSEVEARDYLLKLLAEMNHDFIVSERSDGIWIKWFPDSDQQNMDVQRLVVEHIRALHAASGDVGCRMTTASQVNPAFSSNKAPVPATCR